MDGNGSKANGYIDMVGAANDLSHATNPDNIFGFETAPTRCSASEAVRRKDLNDTDNNSVDFISARYSIDGMTNEEVEARRPRNSNAGEWDPFYEPKEPEPVFYSVYFSVSGGNGNILAIIDEISITSGDLVEEGSSIIFVATPNTDYRVKEWKLNGTTVNNNTSEAYVLSDLSASTTVTVEFDRLPTYEFITEAKPLRAWVNNGILHITGHTIGKHLSVYTITGVLIYQNIVISDEVHIPLRSQGVYIVHQDYNAIRVVYQ